ncbi:hypothetical protein DFH08DRAFT_820434 [Mycena albidolilacea]|uniref:Uncharacterized protein n=1 Tax=Mycena albidolilacea TaxID=1033008 RepID=A0AAD7EF22_9AGAR|nr:hypothetical protein DFH08DRAFT_820434 [Mycena albidolilacea]
MTVIGLVSPLHRLRFWCWMGRSTKLSGRAAKRREHNAEYRQWTAGSTRKTTASNGPEAMYPLMSPNSADMKARRQHLALRALAEMKDRCISQILRRWTDLMRPLAGKNPPHAVLLSELFLLNRSGARQGGRNWLTRDTPLPDFIAPETPLQKKMRRELGEIGPLTAIQQAQINAYRLRHQSRYYKEEDPPLETAPSCLSTARWQRICDWRHGLSDFDTDWDAPVRQELEEETLR